MPMTIEERRQSLYAALLRYTPEAGSLRDRVLDRIVLVALLGTSESEPLRVGAIQQNIKFGPDSPALRTEVIQTALERLRGQKKVEHTELRTRHAYFLTTSGNADVNAAAETAAQLFEPVLVRMLVDTASICTEEQGATVCRRFISECFARFGKQIAKAVTGELTRDELVEAIDARAAFRAAIEGVPLSPEAIESLESRCLRFLRSTERKDEELKFRLTQGYYVAQLLGLDLAQFNPIADEAFRGAIFYLDTNVLLARMLSTETAPLFDEVVRIAERIGIELQVTRATIDETRSVTIGRLEDMKAVIETVPEELVEKTQDDILRAFLELRKEQPDLSPEEFLRRFDEIPNLLQELGITLHDRDAETIVAGRDVAWYCEIVNQAAEVCRGWGKNESVQLHDVCHYLLVLEERSRGRKAWFLTRDRTLSHAAVKLADGGLLFCFPLVGLLQAISPFLESPAEQGSLVDLFSEALERDIHGFPRETLFDLQELKLIGELHEDVLSTPADQLILAFDYVKSNVLDGKTYQQADHPKVALELKKFLASTADERQQALQAEARRQQEIAASERTKREIAENAAWEEKKRVTQLEAKAKAAMKREKDALSRELVIKRSEARLRAALMVLGALIAVGIWRFDSELARLLIGMNSALEAYRELLELGVRFCGSLVLVVASLPTVFFLRPNLRMGVLTFIAAIALCGLDILGSEQLSAWSGYLCIAAPIALALLIIFGRLSGQQP